MFSSEIYGYKKEEVDKYIDDLKSKHEKAIMEEKLKVLEAEKRILETKSKLQEMELREKNVYKILDAFKKSQNEGNRNIEFLRVEQLRVVYNHLLFFLQELNNKVPGILVDNEYKKLIKEIESILSASDAKREENKNAGTENDPMRILLSKMQDKKVESPKEIRIERTDSNRDKGSLIKPVTEMTLEEGDKYDNLVDKFLDSKPPEEETRSIKIQSSGFDLKEAINPKDDLSEIMKAFDFYSGNDED